MGSSANKDRLTPAGRPPKVAAGPPVWLALVLITAAWLLFVTIRFTAPSTIMDDDQERPLAYVMDVLVNGNWLVQRDDVGSITSKPPVYTWVVSLLSLASGLPAISSAYLVSAFAALGTLWLIYLSGRLALGSLTALVAAMLYLLSMMGQRQLILIRTDSLFTLLVIGSAIALVLAVKGRLSWVVFWIIAALAALTKGPQGVLLALFALPGAVLACRQAGERAVVFNWAQAKGFCLFLAIGFGWFLAAWIIEGRDVVDKMIYGELIRHSVKPELNAGEIENGARWWKQPLYFLSQFAPWSLLTLLGIGFVWNRDRWVLLPALSFWALGMVFFSSVSHQRHLLLMPLMPAAALLAAVPLVHFLQITATRRWLVAAVVIVTLYAIGFAAYYHLARPLDRKVSRGAIVQAFPTEVRRLGLDPNQLVFLDAPYSAQVHLGRMQPRLPEVFASQALQAPEPVYIVARGWNPNEEPLETAAGRLAALSGVHVLASWPPPREIAGGTLSQWLDRYRPPADPGFLVILSNRPTVESPGQIRLFHPPLSMVIDGGRPIRVSRGHVEIEPIPPTLYPVVRVKNHGMQPAKVRFILRTEEELRSIRRIIPPGERLVVDNW